MRQRPARSFRYKAEPLLIIEPVNLVDHPVNLVIKVRPRARNLGIMRQKAFQAVNAGKERRNGKPKCSQSFDHLLLRVPRNRRMRTPTMRPEPQRPRCGYACIFLPKRSGGSIARIGEEFCILVFLSGIERCKGSALHIDLAAHFEDIGKIARHLLRNVGNMRDIGSNILAHLPVPARRGTHQLAFLVTKRTGKAINLVLCCKGQRCIRLKREKPPDTRDPFANLLVIEAIIEAHHANFVSDFGKRGGCDLVANLLGRTIGTDQMWERLFQLAVSADKRVIFLIRNLGLVFGVIEFVMPRDLLR